MRTHMEILGTTRLIGILGDPVSHSLSPNMHNLGFEHYCVDFAYVPLRVSGANLKSAIEALHIFNFRGANVTLPHKQAVIPFLDEVSEISQLMGAVNTIVNESGRLIGTTTDPEGFRTGFLEAGYSFANQHIAILGNGGSARTLVFALLTQDFPASVMIVGRSLSKAIELTNEIKTALNNTPYEENARKLFGTSFAEYSSHAQKMEIIVNTTPVGMHPNSEISPLPESELFHGQIVYDIVYVPEKTKLIRLAQSKGLKTVGGLGMLVHQGCASFKLWTGTSPNPELFYKAAREQLNQRGKPEDHKPSPLPGLH